MTQKRALRIPADADQPIAEVMVEGLADYQTIVCGDLEMVEADFDGLAIYLNEIGRLEDLPVNARASALAARLCLPIVGDVLVLGPTDDDGDDTDVTAAHELAIRERTKCQ